MTRLPLRSEDSRARRHESRNHLRLKQQSRQKNRRLFFESLEDRRVLATGVFNNVPEASGYSLIYELDIPANADFDAVAPVYAVDNSAAFMQTFDRVAYYLELNSATFGSQWVYASMNAFTTNDTLINVPNASTKVFQQLVSSMNVFSNVAGIANGTGISTGNIEFWPNDYSAPNQISIPNANTGNLDFGDTRSTGGSHGSMQIHNHDLDGGGAGTAGQTLFAYNNWNSNGANAATLGIGNSPSGNPDWTFATTVGSYTLKKLAVLVRPSSAITSTPQNVSGTAGADTLLLQMNAGVPQYQLNGGAFVTLTGGQFVFDGLGDDDTVTIDTTGGNPIPLAGAQFIGNTDTGVLPGDNIVLQGPATTLLYSFINNNDGSINIDGRILSYTGLEPIADNMVVANRSFSFSGAAETITLADSGGVDGKTSIDSSLGEVVVFNNPTASLTIITNGGDLVNLDSVDPAFAAAVTLDGTGALNTYEWNTAAILPTTTNLTVNGGAATTLDLNGSAVTLGSLAGNGGVNMQATGSLVTGNATNTTYSGILSGGTAGTTRLTKNGVGSFTLANAANSFLGDILVNGGGALAIAGTASTQPNALGSGANKSVTLDNGIFRTSANYDPGANTVDFVLGAGGGTFDVTGGTLTINDDSDAAAQLRAQAT